MNSPIHPPTHTPTHQWECLHRFKIFKQNWNILICSSFITFYLIWRIPLRVGGMCRTCPPTHQIMHPPILICSSFIAYLLIWRSTLGGGWVVMGVCWGGDSSREFKSSNRIEISLFVQALLHFNWFGGPHLGWVGWLDVGVGVWEVAPYMYTCAYMHTCMCSAQWHYRVSPRGQPFAWNYHV